MIFELIWAVSVVIALFVGYTIGKGESVKQNAGLYVIEEHSNMIPTGYSIKPTLPVEEIQKYKYVQFRVVKRLL